jgi:hypothetical protein
VKVYHDWEFYEDGKRIYPLAVAMCDESGRELYAVFEDIQHGKLYDKIVKHHWLMNNVVPHLPLARKPDGESSWITLPSPPNVWPSARGSFDLDQASNRIMSKRMVRNAVRDFILGGRTEEVELWGWYSAYDHVCMAQLFGTMMELPEGFPMLTRDLKQRQDRFQLPDEQLPGYATKSHDPLAEVRLMRDWDQHMDELEIAGQGYSLGP